VVVPMNHWLLALAAAGLALPVHSEENEAEKLFRQAEKNLLAAKTVRVEFDLKTGKRDGGLEAKGSCEPTADRSSFADS
jgi:hypothetical protein